MTFSCARSTGSRTVSFEFVYEVSWCQMSFRLTPTQEVSMHVFVHFQNIVITISAVFLVFLCAESASRSLLQEECTKLTKL